jgi:hypothetical protein
LERQGIFPPTVQTARRARALFKFTSRSPCSGRGRRQRLADMMMCWPRRQVWDEGRPYRVKLDQGAAVPGLTLPSTRRCQPCDDGVACTAFDLKSPSNRRRSSRRITVITLDATASCAMGRNRSRLRRRDALRASRRRKQCCVFVTTAKSVPTDTHVCPLTDIPSDPQAPASMLSTTPRTRSRPSYSGGLRVRPALQSKPDLEPPDPAGPAGPTIRVRISTPCELAAARDASGTYPGPRR